MGRGRALGRAAHRRAVETRSECAALYSRLLSLGLNPHVRRGHVIEEYMSGHEEPAQLSIVQDETVTRPPTGRTDTVPLHNDLFHSRLLYRTPTTLYGTVVVT